MSQKQELVTVFTEEGAYIEAEITSGKGAFFDADLYREFNKDFWMTLLHFGFQNDLGAMHPSLAYLYHLSVRFIERLAKSPEVEFTQLHPPIADESIEEFLSIIPFAIGSEYIDEKWITSSWKKIGESFDEDMSKFGGSVSEYLLHFNNNLNVYGRIYFHLVERKDDMFPFAFMSTYSTKIEGERKAQHLPLKNALNEFRENKDELLKLLSTIDKATKKSEFLSALLESGELFSPLKFTAKDAYTFLKETPIYEESGIICRIPDWWKKRGQSIRLKISLGDEKANLLGLDTLIGMTPSLTFDGVDIGIEEIQELRDMTDGLAMIKGKWIQLDHEKLDQVLSAFENIGNSTEISLGEALKLKMGMNEDGLTGTKDEEITNGQWLGEVIRKIKNPSKKMSMNLPDEFKAKLRAYQNQGFNWLMTMYESKFGALLADDMGLGKTVQILALLDYLRTQKNLKVLLVIPVSLITNWSEEINRFSPQLKYSIIHNKYGGNLQDDVPLFITTYSMVRKNEILKDIDWDLMILDEAQAIKNPGTKQTRAIKQISAKFRVALTGTPIENNLSDLWSIFDFLNPGMLGSASEFSTFLKSSGSDSKQESYTHIKNTIEPFILRRLKTDKNIIKDLPPKIELKAYSTLSKKQTVLYRKIVEDLKIAIHEKEGIEKKGLVLASLVKFKQICNHPSHYLGQSIYMEKDSGKFNKLKEICETIREKHEKVLVFTQFKEIVQPLSNYMAKLFGHEGLVLHGSIPAKKRGKIITDFNEDKHIPFMVLSLRAGGVGLNLTAANHVIHFDRWWNPAVENQATDRVFRIGQKKKVIVHKFITEDTLEEKIDTMLEEKQKLADDIIGSVGEKWITEFDDDELIDLVSLK